MNLPFNPIKGLSAGYIGRMAGMGAGVGAAYGAVSDDSSIVGGAIKGAAFGGTLGVLRSTVANKAWRGGMGKNWDAAKPYLTSKYDAAKAGVQAGMATARKTGSAVADAVKQSTKA